MVGELSFGVAEAEHGRAIFEMRRASSENLTEKLGPGPWSSPSRLPSIRERIALADPVWLRKKTIFVALQNGAVVGSVSVASFLPSFWKPRYWSVADATALGVFDLVVFPHLQRQGLGRYLMGGVEMEARSHGFSVVRLDAFAENPHSVGFYRHIGYDDRGEIDVRGCRLRLFEKPLPSNV